MKPAAVRVKGILKHRVLVTRESARELWGHLTEAMAARGSVTVDFEGVEGMAPSFLDELLAAIEGPDAGTEAGHERRLLITHPPTRLSLKLEAVARGRGMSVEALPDGSWLLRRAGARPPPPTISSGSQR